MLLVPLPNSFTNSVRKSEKKLYETLSISSHNAPSNLTYNFELEKSNWFKLMHHLLITNASKEVYVLTLNWILQIAYLVPMISNFFGGIQGCDVNKFTSSEITWKVSWFFPKTLIGRDVSRRTVYKSSLVIFREYFLTTNSGNNCSIFR